MHGAALYTYSTIPSHVFRMTAGAEVAIRSWLSASGGYIPPSHYSLLAWGIDLGDVNNHRIIAVLCHPGIQPPGLDYLFIYLFIKLPASLQQRNDAFTAAK